MAVAVDGKGRDAFLLSRERHPRDTAAQFIENNVTLIGQASPVFSEWRGSFASLEDARKDEEERRAMWRSADGDVRELLEAVNQAQKKLNYNPSFEIPGASGLQKCSWNGVMRDIEKLSAAWKANRHQQGKTMLFIDKIGRRSSTLESWLELLPNGDYGSSICGAFKLIVNAAGRYSKIEQTVLEALVEIPITMEGARRYVQRYGEMRQKQLETSTFELFRAVLGLLKYIVQYFQDPNWKKMAGAMLLQGGYRQNLSDALAEVKKKADAVIVEANHCQSQQICDTQSSLLEMKRQISTLNQQGKETNRNIEKATVLLEAIWNFFRSKPGLMNISGYLGIQSHSTGLNLSSYDIAAAEKSPGKAIEKALHKTTSSMTEEMREDASLVLEDVAFDPQQPARDVGYVLSYFDTSNDEARCRAACLLQNWMFQDLIFQERRSRKLLVNGQEDLAAADTLSSVRFVAAQLASRIPTALGPSVICIHYFCSQHTPSFSTLAAARRRASPAGMMASLIGQLISQLNNRAVDIDLSFLTADKRQELRELDVDTLYRTFRKIVAQVPPSSKLVCIIDETSVYETRAEHRSDTDFLMHKLAKLARSPTSESGNEPRAIVKLLITNQNRATLSVTGKHFERYTLDMPEFIDVDDAASATLNLQF